MPTLKNTQGEINKSREEQQFYQWMARSTNIAESRRLVYCTALVSHNVTTVFSLAKAMETVPSFLTRCAEAFVRHSSDIRQTFATHARMHACTHALFCFFALLCPSSLSFFLSRSFSSVFLSFPSSSLSLTPLCLLTLRHILLFRPRPLPLPLIPHLYIYPSLGMNEYDADQIALAINDLGLGYFPVRDFEDSLTLESVLFAMNKSNQAKSDSRMAESAMKCCVRVAASNRIMPQLMSDAGICEAVLNIMKKHLADQATNKYACLCVHLLAQFHADISWKLSDLGMCDAIPRSIRCHDRDEEVCTVGCRAIATMSTVHLVNRERFCATGACEMVVKTLINHVKSTPAVEASCQAAINLTIGHMENVGKLLQAGVCLASANALFYHQTDEKAVEVVLAVMNIAATDPNSRANYGSDTPCIPALCQSMRNLMESPAVLREGCLAMATIMNGNHFNRTEFGKNGAVELIAAVVRRYSGSPEHSDVVHAACRAVFSLSAGHNQHKHQFVDIGVAGMLQAIANDPTMHEQARKEAVEALRYLVPTQTLYSS